MRLLDTGVAIDHLRGVQSATDLLVRVLRDGDELAASEIVRFELLSGVRVAEVASLEVFCQSIAWVPVDSGIVTMAGRLARRFRRSHSGIGTADYLIAGTALALGAELLTTNVRHFPMFPELRNPY